MDVQWFGHRQLQWRGLCKKKTKEDSEQEKVNLEKKEKKKNLLTLGFRSLPKIACGSSTY